MAQPAEPPWRCSGECCGQEGLRQALQEAQEEAAWLRERVARLEADLEAERAWRWEWRILRVSSPLTTINSELRCTAGEGWAWRWYAASCPCCKRPLDITLLATEEAAASLAAAAQAPHGCKEALEAEEKAPKEPLPVDSLQCGKVNFWTEERGFGFVAPNGAGPDVVVHGSALANGSGGLQLGAEVKFQAHWPAKWGNHMAHNITGAVGVPLAAPCTPPNELAALTGGLTGSQDATSCVSRPPQEVQARVARECDASLGGGAGDDNAPPQKPVCSVQDQQGGPELETHAWLAGEVKSWSDKRGFGFICPCGNGPDVFVDRVALSDGASLEVGSAVRFKAHWASDFERYAAHKVSGAVAAVRRAYCVALWGAGQGYALGAAVLGARLRRFGAGSGGAPRLVLLHTDDVPPNFLEALGRTWELRLVDYIDGVLGLCTSKGGQFDGVFTKLNAWGLVDFDKILLLDIDTIPFQSLDALFDLEPPAAMIRGNADMAHGAEMDGRVFFAGDGQDPYAWAQTGGINAGVILLRPDATVLMQMRNEVTSEVHPEHIPGNGPEQDYLTRFFASAPWKNIHVSFNYQIHHVPFALERVLQWRRSLAEQGIVRGDGQQGHDWLPPRLALPLEEVQNVHFSGEVKLWHLVVDSPAEHTRDIDTFVAYFLRKCCESYGRWVERQDPGERYADFGCALSPTGRVELLADRSQDVTPLVELAVKRLLSVTRLAATEWRDSCERLFAEVPGLLGELRRPRAPAGCWPHGAIVEVHWCREQREGHPSEVGLWLPATVTAVHADGSYVVQFQSGGAWGNSERHVAPGRVRQPEPIEPQAQS